MSRLRTVVLRHPHYAALLAGFLLHVLTIFVALPAAGGFDGPYGMGFRDDYEKLALNIVEGNGFRYLPGTAESTLREPGYPYALAAMFAIFGYGIFGAQVLNVVLMLGAALLSVHLVRRVTDDRGAAIAAAVLFYVYPAGLIMQLRGGFEPLFAFVLALFSFLVARALESGRRRDFALAGLGLGLVVLVRSSFIAMPAMLLVGVLAWPPAGRSRVSSAGGIATLALSMLLVVTPWAIRTYVVAGEVLATATVSGVAAQVGQYVCRNRDSGRGLQDLDLGARDERSALARQTGDRFEENYFLFFYSTRDEIDFSRQLMKLSMDWYRDHPSDFVACAARNVVNFWVLGRDAVATMLNAAVQVPYILLALAGAVILLRRPGTRPFLLAVVLPIVFATSVHMITFAQARYSAPLVPLMAALGAFPVAMLARMLGIGRRKGGARAPDRA